MLVPTLGRIPWPVARWKLQNSARGRSRTEAGRAELEDFTSPTPATFGLAALIGSFNPNTTNIDEDLFYGTLTDGRFLGVMCGRHPDPTRVLTCRTWFDWRDGTWLQVSFAQTRLSEWREIAEATVRLVDRFAATGEVK